jgi:hypothetical protein
LPNASCHTPPAKPRLYSDRIAGAFLLDGCSLNFPLGPLSGRLRTNSPGSKFLALLPPDKSTESEMMLLFYWGIDGFVTLHKKWKTELRKAALALLGGRLSRSHGQLAFLAPNNRPDTFSCSRQASDAHSDFERAGA